MLGVAIMLLLTTDLSRFKSNVESYVSDVTGRELVIAGSFQLSIGDTIDLVAGNIRLTNADWGTAENILELDRLVVSIDTWSLLSGPIEVLDLQVEGLTLHVEKEPETQQSSWSFGDAPTVTDDADESKQPFELPLWLQQAYLQNVDVTYGRGWLDAPRSITISELSLLEDDSDLLRMALSGAIENEAISASGLVGPLPALLDGRGPRWELQVNVGKFLASTQGTFVNLFTLEGPDIHAVMQGPAAEEILARFGLPPVGRGPVDLEAELNQDGEGIELRVIGAFGDLTTQVTGRADSLTSIQTLELSMDVRGPDVQAVGEWFGAGFLPPAAFIVEGGISGIGDTLTLDSITVSVGDARLEVDGKLAPLDLDPDAQLKLSASGTEIHHFLPATLADRVPSGAFDVRAIAVGGLQQPEVRQLTGRLGEHELTVEGIVPVSADMTGLDIAVLARGPDFEKVIGPWVEHDVAAAPYVASARIRNSGAGFVVDDLAFELANTNLRLTGTAGKLPTFEGLNASITLSGENLQTTMAPWLEIEFPAVPFSVEGDFIAADGALQMSNVAYRLGDVSGTLDGTTGVLTSLDGLQINSSLTGPDASQFVAMLGGPKDSALPALAFQTGGSLSKTSAGWFVKPWTVRIGESRLEMSGALGDWDGAAGIDVDVVASGPDLRRFLPERGIESALPYEVEGGVRIGDDIIELREVELRLGEASAWFDGRLPSGAKLMNIEFDFRIAGPNLQLAGQAFNIQDLAPDAFRFEGAMTRAGQAYSIHDLSAVVGENDLNGRISLEMGPKIRLTGQLDSKYLNLTHLIARRGPSSERDDDTPDPGRIIPDTALPLHLLDAADIDVTLRLQNFRTENLEIGDVELKIVMENDDLHVETGRVSLKNGGTLNASFNLTRSGDEQASVQVNIVGEQFRPRPPIDTDGNPINRPPEDLKLDLSGSGRTIRDLAASADGSISLRLGEGDIDNEFRGDFLQNFVAQVFTSINPADREKKYTRLQCGFFEIDFVDGVARTRALGLQTDKLAVASVGTLNLATEALNLSFRIKQRKGIGVSLAGIVHPYIRVGGTLASPALEFNKKRGLLTSTAAFFTGGLSILAQGVWDRYMSQDDYCQAVIEALDSGEIPVWDGKSDGS